MFNLIAVLMGLALPLVFTVLDIPHALIGAVVLATVLVWPGYVITLLLWPLPGQLDLAQRWSFTPLFSLLALAGVSIFAWVVLQGITPTIIYALTAGAMLVVMLFAHKAVRQLKWQEVAGTWAICVTFGALVASAAAMPSEGLSEFLFPQPGRSPGAFTEFYLIAEGVPRQVIVGEPVTATIGIVNHEGVRTLYTVIVKSGEVTIGASPIISLEEGETWERPIGFIAPPVGDSRDIQFVLQREGYAEPYRTLQLRVSVKPKPTLTPTSTPTATLTPTPTSTPTATLTPTPTPEP